ncbi:MAG: hypothetical protein UV65_C0034G0010 [Parcubacteria group bacterium GW2011_GWF2_43_11]|nr:MAG: hypothetical protein UV65_C0034G0010 [Parcubacteria group bacterium GW2011_GWF2_43_11]
MILIVMEKANKITKEMTIAEVVEKYPKAASILVGFGLHCAGCPGAQSETIGEMAANYQMDLDEFLKNLNKAIRS